MFTWQQSSFKILIITVRVESSKEANLHCSNVSLVIGQFGLRLFTVLLLNMNTFTWSCFSTNFLNKARLRDKYRLWFCCCCCVNIPTADTTWEWWGWHISPSHAHHHPFPPPSLPSLHNHQEPELCWTPTQKDPPTEAEHTYQTASTLSLCNCVQNTDHSWIFPEDLLPGQSSERRLSCHSVYQAVVWLTVMDMQSEHEKQVLLSKTGVSHLFYRWLYITGKNTGQC